MSQLTQEEKRVKLAEWAGWVCDGPWGNFWRAPDAWGVKEKVFSAPPDYFNSLDACHILENTLLTTPQLDEEYYFALKRNHRATAAERAEAIFQVIPFFK